VVAEIDPVADIGPIRRKFADQVSEDVIDKYGITKLQLKNPLAKMVI